MNSETGVSNLLGDAFALAMSDFGDSRLAFLEIDCASLEVRLRKRGSESAVALHGDGISLFKRRFAARLCGEGVRGNLPPAVLVENIPWWLLIGVATTEVAIL